MIYRTWEEPFCDPRDEQPQCLSWSIAEQIDLTDTSITIHEFLESFEVRRFVIPFLKSPSPPGVEFTTKTHVCTPNQIGYCTFPGTLTFTDLDITPALQASRYDFMPEQNQTPESIVAMLYDKPPRFASQLTNYIRDTRPKSIITHDASMVFILSDPTQISNEDPAPTTAPA